MKLILLLNLIFANVFAVNCKLPCGAAELVLCAANNIKVTPEDFFNQKLFSYANIDGFCKNQDNVQVKTAQQKFFFDRFCAKLNTSNLSYKNFIMAANHFPTFACAGDLNNRYKELAAFLTTISQETSSRLYNYTNDGLYFRYENSALKGKTINNKTNYFPKSDFIVAVDDNGNVYSRTLWYGKISGALAYDLTTTPENISWGDIDIPKNYAAKKLNEIVMPGYWIGMGPIQLTGAPLIEFFGWYNNTVLVNSRQRYNLNQFIESYMNNGEIEFSGAFWYWMDRIGGPGFKTLHQIVTDNNRRVCHDIGAVTPIVNGGCNGYNPGRINYYMYYCNLFDVDINPVVFKGIINNKAILLNSMECSKKIQFYCQK